MPYFLLIKIITSINSNLCDDQDATYSPGGRDKLLPHTKTYTVFQAELNCEILSLYVAITILLPPHVI